MIALKQVRRHQKGTRGVPPHYWDQALHQPVNDFLTRDGKRIRADLLDLSYSLSRGVGRPPSQLEGFIELLHAGSLIVDDVQDGAQVRRKRPALHVLFGEPVAINTGNWLYFAALEKLSELAIPTNQHLQLMRRAMTAIRKCHEGQALDLTVNVRATPQHDIRPLVKAISQLKTGTLASLATWMGSVVADADGTTRRAIARFGGRIGVALQMQNDLCELRDRVSGGKPSSDLSHSRATWPWAWASAILSQNEFSRLQGVAEERELAERLNQVVDTRGRRVVSARLRNAVADIRQQLRVDDLPQRCKLIIERLENYDA